METKVPQFFVDIPSFEESLGHNGWFSHQNELSGLNPSNFANIEHNNDDVVLEYSFSQTTSINSIWILGHNLKDANAQFTLSYISGGVESTISANERINYNTGSPTVDGFTMVTFTAIEMENLKITIEKREDLGGDYLSDTIKIGAICLSKAYEMSHSPDLSVQYSIIHDGIKQLRTRGGATLTNTMYDKPADWVGSSGAWQLDNNQNKRMGIRQYGMTFSYYTNPNTFTTNASSDIIDELGGTDTLTTSILDDTDFISAVWNKCNRKLPFIFMPDKDDYAIDQPLIGRFQSDLVISQQAPALQSFSLTVRESF